MCCVRDVAWVWTASSGWCARTRSSRRGCSAAPRSGPPLQPGRGAGASRPGGRLRLVGVEGGLLRRAFARPPADRVRHPVPPAADTLRLVYEFLGEPWHEHDFDQVEYAEPEFDAQLATPGLHTVKAKVDFTPRRRSCRPTCSRNMPASPSGATRKTRCLPHHRSGRGYLVRLIRPLAAGGRRGSSGRISSPSGLSQRQAQVAAHVRQRAMLGSTIPST